MGEWEERQSLAFLSDRGQEDSRRVPSPTPRGGRWVLFADPPQSAGDLASSSASGL